MPRKKTNPNTALSLVPKDLISMQAEITVELNAIFDGLNLSPEIHGECVAMARQLRDRSGKITATDRSQLRELARTMTRAAMAYQFGADAHQVGDFSGWNRCMQTLEKASTATRGLLKDMRLTRSSGAEDESAVEKKARLKTGSEWAGVL